MQCKQYHDALGQVVEHGGLQLKVLAPDNGVGQGELQEEGLEHVELHARSQTKAIRGQAESLRLPGGDGVWDSEGDVG